MYFPLSFSILIFMLFCRLSQKDPKKERKPKFTKQTVINTVFESSAIRMKTTNGGEDNKREDNERHVDCQQKKTPMGVIRHSGDQNHIHHFCTEQPKKSEHQPKRDYSPPRKKSKMYKLSQDDSTQTDLQSNKR